MEKKAALIFVFRAAVVLAALMTLIFLWKFHILGPKPINHHTGDWACLNNLRLIDSSKQQWAEEQHKTAKDTPTWDDMRPYIGHGSNGELPECPIHGVYTLGRVGEGTRCSIHGTVQEASRP